MKLHLKLLISLQHNSYPFWLKLSMESETCDICLKEFVLKVGIIEVFGSI